MLLPARWSGLLPVVWKHTRATDGTDRPQWHLMYSGNDTEQRLFFEFTPSDALSVTLYGCEGPGEMVLLERQVLPIDSLTWQALVTR